MIALLKELILESQESEIEPGIARRLDWAPVGGKATVCIGVRRAGKSTFMSQIMRTEKCEVYITGSSAHMLSKEIATQIRGRALAWEMFPFSFREFLDFKGIDVVPAWRFLLEVTGSPTSWIASN